MPEFSRMRICHVRWLVGVFIILLSSCKRDEPKTIFESVTDSGITFNNKVEDGKLDNSFLFRNFYNGGGVAIGDINNDGLPDIFFTSNTGKNELYLNKGGLKFENISIKAGIIPDDKWYTGAVFADINHDGWLDLYVCSSGNMSNGNRKNKLYINNHNQTFTEAADQYGLGIKAYTTQVSFFDYDMDGDLDCFMINNSPIPVNQLSYSNRRDLPEKDWPVGPFLKGGGDHLYRNDDGHFKEVTYDAGMGIHGGLISLGLGVSVGDINGDGYPDVYISNDSYERDYLYINQKNGTFRDEFEKCIQHTSMSSMGADLADINNDGYPDIFTTDMLPDDDYRLKTTGSFDNIDLYRTKEKAGLYRQYVKNCLQLNNRNGEFYEIANYSGISASDWSWGALMFDADNDGYNDIYVCNGVNRDVIDLDFMEYFANDVMQKMVMEGNKESIDEVLKNIPRNPLINKMFRNKGNLQFEDMGKAWGISQPSFSNGAAYADLDNDGDLDLVVNNENATAFLYKNNSRELNKNSYIGITLKGNGQNTFAIGSKIRVFANGEILSREVIPSRGFQSSMDYKQIIGTGSLKKVDSMIITWPDRSESKFLQPALNEVHIIQQPATASPAPDTVLTSSVTPVLTQVPGIFDKHQEDDYIDFYYERNIPEMLSREGPKATTGDVDGNGTIDIYIGGTPGHPGQIYLQDASGKFAKKTEPAFQHFGEFEDEAVLLFDADQDGDLDLFVGPGGNNNPSFSTMMLPRFFKNDGKGNFTSDPTVFQTKEGVNTGVVIPYDFNHDGYIDLFVGGRSLPREYGVSPSSFLYVNDGHGHFSDIAKTKNPDIANIGMVTGAIWADIAGDKDKELVIVGEWMCPRIFSFKKDRFEEIKTNLSNLYGWWQTVAAADVNGDGKEDLLLGNIGENFYLHPDEKNPVKLWINDFDQNNAPDIVMSSTVNGRDMPVFLKKDMQDQLPLLKKKNLRNAEYAKKSIEELFLEKDLTTAVQKKFNYTKSCMAINKGDGQFSVEAFDPMVQLSSVNAINYTDVNGDGLPDLVLGGNNFCFIPQFGRLDASLGHVLLNEGKGRFKWLYPDQSGLNIKGQVRDITVVPSGSRKLLLFLVNDEYPQLFEMKTIVR